MTFSGLSWGPVDDKKGQERHVVQVAARLLQETWRVSEGESPDFTVLSGDNRFGLEVTELFVGSAGRKGDPARRAEASNSAWLEEIRLTYAHTSDASLYVSYRGPISAEIGSEILLILEAENLASKAEGYWFKAVIGAGSLHVRVGLDARWLYLDDMEGWASFDSGPLVRAIERKSAKVSDYRRGSTHEDIRLLAFNNPWLNSGRLLITNFDGIDRGAFSAIYVLYYPFEVTIIDNSGWRTYPNDTSLPNIGTPDSVGG